MSIIIGIFNKNYILFTNFVGSLNRLTLGGLNVKTAKLTINVIIIPILNISDKCVDSFGLIIILYAISSPNIMLNINVNISIIKFPPLIIYIIKRRKIFIELSLVYIVFFFINFILYFFSSISDKLFIT